MSCQIVLPTLFEGNLISAEVILDICNILKRANLEIEELILDEVVPDREDMDRASIMNAVAEHFSNQKSFDALIRLKKNKINLMSSVAFLFFGKSTKKDINETSKLLVFWKLDQENLFNAICISLHVLLEIFLSDHAHFSYGEFYFNRSLERLSKFDIDAIYEVNIPFSAINPMMDTTDDLKIAISNLAAHQKQSDVKFDRMMEAILSLKTELSSVKEKASTQRKEPKSTFQNLQSNSSARIDKGNYYSRLSNLHTDDIQEFESGDDDDVDEENSKSLQNESFVDDITEFTSDDSGTANPSKSYSPMELSFINEQIDLWKSNVSLSNPREIHVLSSLAANKGLLIAQASGQLTILRTLKTSVKTSSSYELWTLGTKFVDCQTNILFPRSYPEMSSYFNETSTALQKIVGKQIVCKPEIRGWALVMSQHIHTFYAKLIVLFKHSYKAQYSITQYAILLRVHIWCMNVAVMSKNPAYLDDVDLIWDRFIKHEFDSTPTGEKLLSACALIGYRCLTCFKMSVPSQLCSTCFSAQLITKPGPFVSKSQLEKDHSTWTTSPDGLTWLASNSKSNSWSYYCAKIATSAQKEAHNKLKKPANAPRFATHAKCLSHYALNQHEIPLLCSSEHYAT